MLNLMLNFMLSIVFMLVPVSVTPENIRQRIIFFGTILF